MWQPNLEAIHAASHWPSAHSSLHAFLMTVAASGSNLATACLLTSLSSSSPPCHLPSPSLCVQFRSSKCWNGNGYERAPMRTTPCSCSEEDYGCDFGS